MMRHTSVNKMPRSQMGVVALYRSMQSRSASIWLHSGVSADMHGAAPTVRHEEPHSKVGQAEAKMRCKAHQQSLWWSAGEAF